MILLDESRRVGRSKHTEASGCAGSLAGGACRRCRDRPDLCQPPRTRTGESERRGARKAGARAVVEHRGIFHGTPGRGGRRATSCPEQNMKGKGRGLSPNVVTLRTSRPGPPSTAAILEG